MTYVQLQYSMLHIHAAVDMQGMPQASVSVYMYLQKLVALPECFYNHRLRAKPFRLISIFVLL